jgi:putative ABC transport system substrate-binding protein
MAIRNEQELNEALERFPSGIDAIYLPTDSMMVSFTPRFVEFALMRRLILSSTTREGVRQGALYSYGFSIFDVGFQAARLTAQVMQGVLPKDLPVELADFKLVINRETAAKIGLEIPADILRHAETVP